MGGQLIQLTKHQNSDEVVADFLEHQMKGATNELHKELDSKTEPESESAADHRARGEQPDGDMWYAVDQGCSGSPEEVTRCHQEHRDTLPNYDGPAEPEALRKP